MKSLPTEPPLKIPLAQITSTVQETVFSQDVQLKDQSETRLVTPVKVAMEHYRSENDLFFDGMLISDAEGICSRCLKEYRFKLEKKFSFVLTPDTLPINKYRELNSDELGLSSYTGDEVDLAPLIQEQTILALPIRPLCSDECLGLCPDCGADRNEAECSCGESSGDQRMGVFRNLRVDR